MEDSSTMVEQVLPQSTINHPLEQPNYNINNLTDSILIEILTRVHSCKAAQQCKSVCKNWLSLISSPYFVTRFVSVRHDASPIRRVFEPVTFLHQYRYFAYHDIKHDISVRITSHPVHTKVDAITNHSELQSRNSFELDFLPFFLTAEIVASSQDLLVCYDGLLSFELLKQGQGTTFYVCNLLTKEWIALPPGRTPYWASDLIGFITYETEPCKPKVRQFIRDYKLIHISKSKDFYAEVFSSETGEWSESKVLSCGRFDIDEKYITNPITFRKKLHWIINKNSILSFDPFCSDNQSRLIDLTALAEDGQSNKTECIGVYEEHLLLSQLVRVNGKHRFKIWHLKDYNAGKWCLKHNVSLNEMEIVGGHLIEYEVKFGDVACLLAVHPHEKTVLYLRYKSQILKCNVKEQTLEMVRECNKSWTWHVTNERDKVFPLVHPCWPSQIQPS